MSKLKVLHDKQASALQENLWVERVVTVFHNRCLAPWFLAAHMRDGPPLLVSGESAARVVNILCAAA